MLNKVWKRAAVYRLQPGKKERIDGMGDSRVMLMITLIYLTIYTCKISVAIAKYITSDKASTIVVINGLAITAGSNPSLFAKTGRLHPIILAIATAAIKVRQTTAATPIPTLSNNISFTKYAQMHEWISAK